MLTVLSTRVLKIVKLKPHLIYKSYFGHSKKYKTKQNERILKKIIVFCFWNPNFSGGYKFFLCSFITTSNYLKKTAQALSNWSCRIYASVNIPYKNKDEIFLLFSQVPSNPDSSFKKINPFWSLVPTWNQCSSQVFVMLSKLKCLAAPW